MLNTFIQSPPVSCAPIAACTMTFDNRRLDCDCAVFGLYPARIAACVAFRSIRYSLQQPGPSRSFRLLIDLPPCRPGPWSKRRAS